MSKKLSSVLLVISLPLITFVYAPSSAQQEAGGQALPFNDLTLEMSTTKVHFVHLEPIPITLRLANRTAEPILGHNVLRWGTPYVELYVVGSDGGRRKVPLTNASINIGGNSLTIQPGQSYEATQLLRLGLGETFPQPGQYTLQAMIYGLNPSEKVDSNLLTIDIKEPHGKDAEAAEFIRNKANTPDFFNSVYSSKPKVVEEFISKYADTVFGDYAVLMLGEYYFVKGDFEKALKHFLKLADKKDFAFADKVKEYIEKVMEKLDRASEDN